MPADRRTWSLIGLGAIAVGLVVWTLQGQGQAPAAPVATPTPPPSGAPGTGVPVIEDVRLDALSASRAEPSHEGRNPFRFEAPRPAAAERQPEAAPAPPVIAAPMPAGPPPLPPIPFKFIGIVERMGTLKVAVLTDGRSVVHGKEGDIIEGQYRILRIGVESIEMAYVDGRGRQTIRLTGQ
jgi:hypothetical protein